MESASCVPRGLDEFWFMPRSSLCRCTCTRPVETLHFSTGKSSGGQRITWPLYIAGCVLATDGENGKCFTYFLESEKQRFTVMQMWVYFCTADHPPHASWSPHNILNWILLCVNSIVTLSILSRALTTIQCQDNYKYGIAISTVTICIHWKL